MRLIGGIAISIRPDSVPTTAEIWRRPASMFYDETVFEQIAHCRPSARQELEITDVNNMYIAEGTLEFSRLEDGGPTPAPFESLLPS